ncbi:protein unc-93 homolog A [Parasteatoda tepidariorum]|uniref:protein unc-93 homolog A n=1 Tax=Parasteatoda tepidariorum TaxID=114398 RepID=UPI00077FB55C|nr:protein unc-93 homolog A [Parasteatoda tepidariorum]
MVVEKIHSTFETVRTGQVFSKPRIYKNLIIVCIGYLFMFSAYQGLANLQSTLNIEGNIGVISQSVIYVSMIISSLFLPKLIIRKYGCKATLVMSALLYAPYIAVNFYPGMGTFLPAAFILGLAAPALWSAKCTYLNEISALYASQDSDSADVVTNRFFGIFFMVFQTTQIWGNLVSFYVLRPSEGDEDGLAGTIPTLNETVTCGADFCFGVSENMKAPSDEKKHILIGIYLFCIVLAALIMGLFLDSYDKKKADDTESLESRILATLKHMKKTKQLLLVPLTVFSGLEQGFILGDFTKAYVACAWGIYYVGLVFIFFGAVNSVVSFTSGRLAKYIPRVTIFISGAIGNLAVCLTLLLWKPNSEQYVVFFVLAGVWGLSDGIWQTMINSLYGILFRSDEEAAFSNYRLWESLGFAIAFLCSSLLCVTPKIYIVVIILVIGMMGYITVEILVYFERKNSS